MFPMFYHILFLLFFSFSLFFRDRESRNINGHHQHHMAGNKNNKTTLDSGRPNCTAPPHTHIHWNRLPINSGIHIKWVLFIGQVCKHWITHLCQLKIKWCAAVCSAWFGVHSWRMWSIWKSKKRNRIQKVKIKLNKWKKLFLYVDVKNEIYIYIFMWYWFLYKYYRLKFIFIPLYTLFSECEKARRSDESTNLEMVTANSSWVTHF